MGRVAKHQQQVSFFDRVGAFLRDIWGRIFSAFSRKGAKSAVRTTPARTQPRVLADASAYVGGDGFAARLDRKAVAIINSADPALRDNYPFRLRKRNRNALISALFLTLKIVLVCLALCGICAAGAVVGVAKAYMDTSPVLDISQLSDADLTSFIYDSNGQLITTLSGLENRIYAGIEEIPLNLQHAIVAIEDERFYDHNGVNLKRIIGAFMSNLTSSGTQGGSTLTQQLVKLELLSSERTYKRKIQEAWLAMQLEKQYTKDQILEAYLNTITLANGNYGVKAAAQDYFGKELSALTLRECAMLAGMAQSPYTYDPRANTYERNKMDVTDRRTDTVLMKMYENGYISREEYDAALAENVHIENASKTADMYDMPYIVEYAIYDVISSILQKRSLEDTQYNRSLIQSELRTGGYKIYTTIDRNMQLTLEDTVFNYEKYPAVRYSQDKYILTQTSDSSFTKVEQPQAAAVIIDYRTGDIKAMVGGRQQPTQRMTLNRAYQSHMPVGSTIKPLAVYGPALDLGYSPATVVQNVALPVTGWTTERGYPNNYGGGGFTGPTTLRYGLRQSLNIVAARTLMDLVGVKPSVEYLKKMGVTQGINEDGAGLALGTSGISPLEMAAAYGSIANGGIYISPHAFTKVEDSAGNTVITADEMRENTTVFKPSTCYMLLDMLTDAVENGSGRNARITGMTVAGKTGTNSDAVGVSFSGITPYYVSSVWIGQDNYKPLYSGAQGGKDAAPLWKAYMSKILEGAQNKPIMDVDPASIGLVKVKVCSVTGLPATDACESDPLGRKPYEEWMRSDSVPLEVCNLHVAVKICSDSKALATANCPEDKQTDGMLMVIPEDSPINALSDEDKALYYPNAVYGLSATLLQEEPSMAQSLHPELYCTIHSDAWHSDQSYSTLKANSEAAIADITARMKLATWLSDVQRQSIEDGIDALRNAIALGRSNSANIQKALTDLQSTANGILNGQ